MSSAAERRDNTIPSRYSSSICYTAAKSAASNVCGNLVGKFRNPNGSRMDRWRPWRELKATLTWSSISTSSWYTLMKLELHTLWPLRTRPQARPLLGSGGHLTSSRRSDDSTGRIQGGFVLFECEFYLCYTLDLCPVNSFFGELFFGLMF